MMLPARRVTTKQRYLAKNYTLHKPIPVFQKYLTYFLSQNNLLNFPIFVKDMDIVRSFAFLRFRLSKHIQI